MFRMSNLSETFVKIVYYFCPSANVFLLSLYTYFIIKIKKLKNIFYFPK